MSDDDIFVYSLGLCYASVCCLPTENPAEIEAAVNALHPTGVTPWRVADEPFANGSPNPSPCNSDPERIHVLLHC